MQFSAKTFLLLASLFTSAHAAETDQVTRLDYVLKDSSLRINELANKYLQSSIQKLNAESAACEEKKLYKELRKYYANHISGIMMKEILKDSSIDKRVIPFEESIFKDFKFYDSLGLGLKIFKSSGLTLTSVLKIGEHEIGTDKLEHFFGQGFYYFTDHYLQNVSLQRTLKRGIAREKTILGGNKLGNGVFSYGDLGANFNGMRFWNHILQKKDDVLGAEENIGPYIKCVESKWVQVKATDFRSYIDNSMNEAINCSKFPSARTAEKVKKAIAKKGYHCPIEQSKYSDLKLKYGELSHWILNDDGISELSYFNEF